MRTGGITVTAVLGDAEFGDNATRRSLPGWQRHVGLTNERFFVGTDNKGTATADDDVKLVKLDPDGRDAWWAIEDSDPLAIASEPETGSPPARSCPKLSCAGPLGKDRRQRLLHDLAARAARPADDENSHRATLTDSTADCPYRRDEFGLS